MLSSPLKWAGGKSWLLPRLVEIYSRHRHRRLVEPFVGGMNVALGLDPEEALLGDVNVHLINFYSRLRDTKRFSLTMENDEFLFYAYRKCFNRLIKDEMRFTHVAAELFYYLNRTCFNGLCRFNTKGEFNVPFGKYTKINYKTDFSEYAEKLQRWKIEVADFRTLAGRVQAADFVFLDPPYDGTFVDYSVGGFSWADQEELARLFSCHTGPVVVTNQATDRVLQLYRDLGFQVTTLEAPRRISSDGNRTPAAELFATKNVDV